MNLAKIDFDNLTKSQALKYSNAMSRKMNFAKDEDMENILKAGYIYSGIDVADIKARFACLRPDNMFVLYHS